MENTNFLSTALREQDIYCDYITILNLSFDILSDLVGGGGAPPPAAGGVVGKQNNKFWVWF